MLILMVGAFVWISIAIFGPSGLGKITSLETQITSQRSERERLAKNIATLRERVQQLRTGDGQVESLARYHFGLIKESEIFIQLYDPNLL